MQKARHRLLLLAPLAAFLLVFFAGPIAGLLSKSVREVARTTPNHRGA
jgi:ABC-type sugar transport system permease subunit